MAEALDEAFMRPGTMTLFVSRNLDAAVHLLSYGYRMVSRLGLHDNLTKSNETEMALTNGSRLKSLPASRDTGRGFDADRIYVDEAAFQLWAEEVYGSITPAIARGGRLTMVSTPKGRRNLFFRIWAGLEGGNWKRHLIPWQACPLYDEDWERRERPRYSAQQWAQEFGCDFVESGLTRFRAGDIEAAHDGATGFAEPQRAHRYLTAWDIGRHHDATVGITLDVSQEPYQVVRYERHTGLPYPRIQTLIGATHRWHKGRTVMDSTGAGDPVKENLDVPAGGFVFTARSKEQALEALAMLLEQHRLKFPYIRELEEELLGYEDDDNDLIQDSVMALAIAAYTLRHKPWKRPGPTSLYGALPGDN